MIVPYTELDENDSIICYLAGWVGYDPETRYYLYRSSGWQNTGGKIRYYVHQVDSQGHPLQFNAWNDIEALKIANKKLQECGSDTKTPDDDQILYNETLEAYFAYCDANGYVAERPDQALCKTGYGYVWLCKNDRPLARYDYLNKEIVTSDEWVSMAEAAELLNLSRPRITQLLKSGKLKGQLLHRRAMVLSRLSVEWLKDSRGGKKGEKSQKMP